MAARVARWVGAVLWVALPIVGILAVTRSGDDRAGAPGAEWSPVGRGAAERSQRVSLDLRFGPAANVFAPPGLTGLVEAVQVRPGASIEDGKPIATIGGIERVGVVSAVPFSRTLQHGQSGSDVAQLNQVLRSRGLAAGEGERFDDATERGVIALSKQLGSPGSAVFDPSWFVFIPKEATAVTKVAVQPGMPAPADGEPILDLAPALIAASWADPNDAASSGGATAPDLANGARLIVNGTPVGELTSKNADGSGLVGLAILSKLASLLPPDAETADGVVVSAAPSGSSTIGAASIYTDDAGRTCVRWRSTPTSGTHRTRIAVVDSVGGDAVVTGLPDEATRVQVNPPTALRRQCQ